MRNILLDFVRRITPSLLISLLSPLKFKRGNSRLGGRGEILSSKRGGTFAITIMCLFFFGSVSAAGVNYNNTTFKPLVTSGDVVGQFANCSGEQYLGADGECHDVSSGGFWDAATGGINYAGGNVGIGTTSPDTTLELQKNGDVSLGLSTNTYQSNASIYLSESADPSTGGSQVYYDGTANSFKIATGAASFTDRLTILRDGGNVGIGTTSPDVSLDIETTDAAGLRIYRDSGNSGIQIQNNNDVVYFGMNDADNIALGYSADHTNSPFQITPSGNVGIGTTSPSAKLHIDMPAPASLSTRDGQMLLESFANEGINNYGSGIIFGQVSGPSSANLGSSIIGVQTATDTNAMGLTFNVHGSASAGPRVEAMRINASGNVGIGTTSPVGGRLEVIRSGGGALPPSSGTTSAAVTAFGFSTENQRLYFGTNTNSPYGSWLQVSSSVNLATNYPLLLNPNGGNVGIGTATPRYALEVSGTSNMAYLGSSTDGVLIYNSAGVAGLIGHDGSGYNDLDIRAKTGAGSQLYLKTDGNVGIGDTAPESKLDVNGDIHLTDMTAPTTTTNKLYSVGGVLKWAGATVATGDLTANTISQLDSSVTVTDTGTNGTITMKTDNVARMTIDEDGNVGIGTASPMGKLDISAAGNSEVLSLVVGADSSGTRTDNSVKYSRFGMPNYDIDEEVVAQIYSASTESENLVNIGGGTYRMNAATKVRFYTAENQVTTTGTERMIIDSTGKVGIGVTSPTKKLHVDGGARFDNTSSTDAVELGDGKIYWDTTNSELVIQVN